MTHPEARSRLCPLPRKGLLLSSLTLVMVLLGLAPAARAQSAVTITGFSPDSIDFGGTDWPGAPSCTNSDYTTVTITGTGFDTSTTAKFNGADWGTNYVSPTKITTNVDFAAYEKTGPGTLNVTVTNESNSQAQALFPLTAAPPWQGAFNPSGNAMAPTFPLPADGSVQSILIPLIPLVLGDTSDSGAVNGATIENYMLLQATVAMSGSITFESLTISNGDYVTFTWPDHSVGCNFLNNTCEAWPVEALANGDSYYPLFAFTYEPSTGVLTLSTELYEYGRTCSYSFKSDYEAIAGNIAAIDAPVVSNPDITFSGLIAGDTPIYTYAYGNYTYSNAASGIPEDGSTYAFLRATDANGDGAAPISGSYGASHALAPADNNQYLQFCDTPKDQYGTAGTQSCSGWTAVGPLLQVYSSTGFSGVNANIAYQDYPGNCINAAAEMNDSSEPLLSFVLNAPPTAQVYVQTYTSTGCAGTPVLYGPVAPGSSLAESSVGNVASMLIISVTASNVALAISGSTATGSYSYSDSQGLPESGSTYTIQRASDANGTGATTVATSTTYALGNADNGAYLQFCVTPSDGTFTGARACSGWVAVGPLVVWFSADGQTGSAAGETYSNGICVNVNALDLGFTPASLALYAQPGATTYINMYEKRNCTAGVEFSKSSGAGSFHDMNLDTVGIGSSLASYEIYW